MRWEAKYSIIWPTGWATESLKGLTWRRPGNAGCATMQISVSGRRVVGWPVPRESHKSKKPNEQKMCLQELWWFLHLMYSAELKRTSLFNRAWISWRVFLFWFFSYFFSLWPHKSKTLAHGWVGEIWGYTIPRSLPQISKKTNDHRGWSNHCFSKKILPFLLSLFPTFFSVKVSTRCYSMCQNFLFKTE